MRKKERRKKVKRKKVKIRREVYGRGPSHTQPHNKKDEDLEVVDGFILQI